MAKLKFNTSYDLFSGYSHYAPGIGGMFALLGCLLLGAIMGNGAMMLIMLFSEEAAATYGMLISYPLMFLPAMFYASFQSSRNRFIDSGIPLDRNNFGMFTPVAIALAVSIATIATGFVFDYFNGLMPPMPEALEAAMKALMEGPLWATLLSVSVFAPLFEEWLCRGMILRGLLGRMKPIWAILISATVFALIHLNPWQAIPAFAFGLLFGYVYYKTGSLKLTMLMHCVNNTASALMGRMEQFKDAESFMDVLPMSNYLIVMLMCILMVAFFVYRTRGIETEWK